MPGKTDLTSPARKVTARLIKRPVTLARQSTVSTDAAGRMRAGAGATGLPGFGIPAVPVGGGTARESAYAQLRGYANNPAPGTLLARGATGETVRDAWAKLPGQIEADVQAGIVGPIDATVRQWGADVQAYLIANGGWIVGLVIVIALMIVSANALLKETAAAAPVINQQPLMKMVKGTRAKEKRA